MNQDESCKQKDRHNSHSEETTPQIMVLVDVGGWSKAGLQGTRPGNRANRFVQHSLLSSWFPPGFNLNTAEKKAPVPEAIQNVSHGRYLTVMAIGMVGTSEVKEDAKQDNKP